jgi:hypothetical protein
VIAFIPGERLAMDHGGDERGLDSEKGEDRGCEIFSGKRHGRKELTRSLS